MTTPDNPGPPPADQPPQYGDYSAPQYGQPPAPSGYGAPPGQYGTAPGTAFASWLQRVGARIIDGLVVIPGLIIVVIGLGIGGGAGAAIAILGYLACIAIGIWNVVVREGNTGQSIGKSVLDIKLIREQDGQVTGPGMSFVRQLAHFLDSVACYVGWFWPLWDAKKQTFADKVCNTVVVQV